MWAVIWKLLPSLLWMAAFQLWFSPKFKTVWEKISLPGLKVSLNGLKGVSIKYQVQIWRGSPNHSSCVKMSWMMCPFKLNRKFSAMVGCQLSCVVMIYCGKTCCCLLLPQLNTKTNKQVKKRTFLCSGHAGVDAEGNSREGNRSW